MARRAAAPRSAARDGRAVGHGVLVDDDHVRTPHCCGRRRAAHLRLPASRDARLAGPTVGDGVSWQLQSRGVPSATTPISSSALAETRRVDDLLAHLRERNAWLDGVVVTGGEPCIDPHLPRLLSTLRAEGMPVKLDTNGTRPDVLSSLVADGLVDFVALDVKAEPERYERASGVSDVWPAVERSIALILGSGVDHEFRTTCYPPAVGPDDLVHIAARLAGGKRYVLQQFRPLRTLDPAAVSVRPVPRRHAAYCGRTMLDVPPDLRERHVMRLPIKRLDPDLPLPRYAHEGDAGLDLLAAEDIVLQPFERALIATGIAVAIPDGYAGFVQPRSGLAIKQGLTLVNTPGLIDSHYRGEIKVIAINLDPATPIRVKRGDKIAQFVIQPVVSAELVEVDELDDTVRGEGGFGSTGV